MPKPRAPSVADIIRSAQDRAGFYRQTEKMCRICCISPSTFKSWLREGDLPLSGLRRLNTLLHFTEEEREYLIRG